MNIYLFGNCQATALAKMITEDHPDWTVDACDVSSLDEHPTPEDGDRHLARVGAADIVISQPVHAWQGVPGLSLAATRGTIRAASQLITFPSIVFEGTHGAFSYMAGRLQGHRMPYHNTHTIDMFTRGYRREDMVLLQNAPAFYTRDFVLSGVAASLAELRGRERHHETTIGVADLIEEACGRSVLMHTMNHPKRPLLARTLNRVYCAMSERQTAREAGEDYLRLPHIPPLPTVLAHLGLKDEAPLVITDDGVSWSREDYLRGSIDYYARLLRPTLLEALSESRGQAFLEAFYETPVKPDDAGKPPPLDIAHDVDTLVRSAFAVFLDRTPPDPELAAHVHAIRSIGMHGWLSTIAAAPEFQANFVSVRPNKP